MLGAFDHSSWMLYPNTGVPAFLYCVGARELRAAWKAAKTFSSSMSERTARRFLDARVWSSSTFTNFRDRPFTPPALLTVSK